jgi:hypothetical protein
MGKITALQVVTFIGLASRRDNWPGTQPLQDITTNDN